MGSTGSSTASGPRRRSSSNPPSATRSPVWLPETDEILAINYVERVRSACEHWLESGAIGTRLSIGWACSTGDASMASVVRTATERMYTEERRHHYAAGS